MKHARSLVLLGMVETAKHIKNKFGTDPYIKVRKRPLPVSRSRMEGRG